MRAISLCFLLATCTNFLFAANEVEHHFRIDGEFVYFKRAKAKKVCLVKQNESIKDEIIIPCKMTAKDLVHHMDFEPGFKITASYLHNQKHSLEGAYLGNFQWKGNKTYSGRKLFYPFVKQEGNTFIPNDTLDYVKATKVKGRYRSSLWTSELNYLYHVTPRNVDYFSFTVLAGGRYADVNEKLKLIYQRDLSVSDYKVGTRSQTFGPQVGFDFQLCAIKNWIWALGGKFGLLANYGDQKTKVLDNDNSVTLISSHPNGWNVNYMGQATHYTSYYFTDWFYIKLNYELLYFSDMILAPNQLATPNRSGRGLKHKGDVLYHGFLAGLGFYF